MTPAPDYVGGQPYPYSPPSPYLPPQAQPPYYPLPRRKIPKRPLAAMVFAILGVVLLCTSLATPWWGLKMDMSMSTMGMSMSMKVDAKTDFEGTKATIGMDYLGMSMSVTCSTSWNDDSAENATATKGLYKTTQAIDVLATVMTVLLLAGSVIMLVRPQKKMLAVIFGLVAVIVCILGPVYFATGHPAAMKTDQDNHPSATTAAAGLIPGLSNLTGGDTPSKSFSGSASTSLSYSGIDAPVKMSWGPESGWYIALAGFAMTVVAFAIILTCKRPSPQDYVYGSQPQYPGMQAPYHGQPAQWGPDQGVQLAQAPAQQYPTELQPRAPEYPSAQQTTFEYVPTAPNPQDEYMPQTLQPEPSRPDQPPPTGPQYYRPPRPPYP